MGRKLFTFFLITEALLCILYHVTRASFTGVFSAALAFPFEQLGMGLRRLSLSGGVGNAAALVIYAALCALPLLQPLIARRRGLYPEDWLLFLLGALLLPVLYLMTNPHLISSITRSPAGIPTGKAMLGGTVYSVVVGYIVLRVLRLFSSGGIGELARYLKVLLCVLGALFVYLAFGDSLGRPVASAAALREGNTGNGHLLTASYVFLALRTIIQALTYLLDTAVVFAALRLLDELRADRWSDASATAASRAYRLCKISLAATVLIGIGFDLFQLLFAGALMNIGISLELPVFSIAFVLAALLMTRLIEENRLLKHDNDLFV